MLPVTDISSQPELFRQQEDSTAGMWGYYASGQKSSIKIQANPMKIPMQVFILLFLYLKTKKVRASAFLSAHKKCVIIYKIKEG
jgi:hypothetical protein